MTKSRAFLKWAGGKYKLVDDIAARLPHADRLVEPFVGAGSVFLNTNFSSYLLSDINPDLIGLYNTLKQTPERYVREASKLFIDANNDKDAYYGRRAEFNQCHDRFDRAVLFLYLNRFGYNGLCRYNKSGGFNVPFGSYKRPYFPEKELYFFAEKAQRATFLCEGYVQTFARCQAGDVVYCDPPYLPLSTTSNFTSYASGGFSLDDQAMLAFQAEDAARSKKLTVLISNHDTTLARKLYDKAQLDTIQVGRSISQNGRGRKKVNELMALYRP
ncbi:Dam family site-specific DNA-(adenine-N6)-methyltransferase [Ferrimonas balearica]|uniref:Dam family site-specific DNA-(adenine-N6)-methyltransferase n=1 Tax=Ferrimonas balearica TaxID=44012 RepID=UPI001F33DE6F|nr:Dam family site-specific DNA-(adenine-N6)-methyltransferase [Ferrimonas balearica]MBY6018519.1 Dam family site-specific DNA-(adenine-N6)-methyltransferase [Halomonas denitrificans]MBY6096530.1 Dam family site-specific DNA-(adenine-N6)-methyltransferase [Ferrimonas balearica]